MIHTTCACACARILYMIGISETGFFMILSQKVDNVDIVDRFVHMSTCCPRLSTTVHVKIAGRVDSPLKPSRGSTKREEADFRAFSLLSGRPA